MSSRGTLLVLHYHYQLNLLNLTVIFDPVTIGSRGLQWYTNLLRELTACLLLTV